jgi:hypothetical protein
MHSVIESPADWRGPDVAKRTDWIHEFTPEEIAEIESATRHALASGKTLESLTKDDFPLPLVSQRLAHARTFLEEGLGIYQFRGINVDGYDKATLRLMYWGIGKHMGTAVSQSKDGDLLAGCDAHLVGVATDSDGCHGQLLLMRIEDR